MTHKVFNPHLAWLLDFPGAEQDMLRAGIKRARYVTAEGENNGTVSADEFEEFDAKIKEIEASITGETR